MTATQPPQSEAGSSPTPRSNVSDLAPPKQTIPNQRSDPHLGDVDDETRPQPPTDPLPIAITTDPAAPIAPVLDIEHQIVDDDPRLWSDRKKALCVSALMLGALAPTLGANIFLPALKPLSEQLHATSASISLAVSLYILFQGIVPLIWSSISELIGRKIIFISGSIIFTVTSLVCSRANSMALLIVMRCLSAAGSSPMLSIGAGTLADMYEPHQRGTVVGLYYAAPLIGPAISPIIGGALTEADSWRATFYFLTAAGFAMIVCFTFVFKETFRPARSIAWTQAKERALRKAEAARAKQLVLSEKRQQLQALDVVKQRSETNTTNKSKTDVVPKRSSTLSTSSSDHTALDSAATPQRSRTPPNRERPQEPFQPPQFLEPASSPPLSTSPLEPVGAKKISIAATPEATRENHTAATGLATTPNTADEERRGAASGLNVSRPISRSISRAISRTQSRVSVLSNKVVTSTGEEITFKPSLADVNPIRPFLAVLSEPHNIVSLVASGLSFGSYYSLSLTVTLTLTAAKGSRTGGYGFSPIIVGCVLLAVGGGGMAGSIIGGRLSDRRIRRIKSGALVSPLVSPTSVEAAAWHAARSTKSDADVEASGHEQAPEIVVEPEERLISCKWVMIFVPLCYITYGWLAQNSVNIGALCAVLFVLGASLFSVYACTLSYVVDSNKGRGSSAVACNSAFRGSVAFVASEIASTLLRKMGNGWLYTGWAIALAVIEAALFFIAFQGPRWRREGFERRQDWRFLRPRNWKA